MAHNLEQDHVPGAAAVLIGKAASRATAIVGWTRRSSIRSYSMSVTNNAFYDVAGAALGD
jgi:hypothetical protein